MNNPDVRTFLDYQPAPYNTRADDLGPRDYNVACDIHWSLTTLANQLLTMWVDKVGGYGLSRYDEHDEVFDMWMCFSDLHRKAIRLEELTRSGTVSAPLIDAYADMALYCISNLHVLMKHLPNQEEQE